MQSVHFAQEIEEGMSDMETAEEAEKLTLLEIFILGSATLGLYFAQRCTSLLQSAIKLLDAKSKPYN